MHKHAEILIAIAEGKEIETRDETSTWGLTRADVALCLLAKSADSFQFRVKEPFIREDRYFVLKYKDMLELTNYDNMRVMNSLNLASRIMTEYCPKSTNREYAVVESDWSCYEDVWKLIEKEDEKSI